MVKLSTEELKKLTNQEKIFYKFRLLKEESEIDCAIDRQNLESGFNVTMNLEKWIRKKSEWNMAFRDFEGKRKKIYRTLWEFYNKDFPLKLSTKDEYTLFIESDPQYTDCYNNSAVIKEIIMFIDSIIETLKNKQWEIKNIIQWRMFQQGR